MPRTQHLQSADSPAGNVQASPFSWGLKFLLCLLFSNVFSRKGVIILEGAFFLRCGFYYGLEITLIFWDWEGTYSDM